jgi:hypothetical protein
MEPPLPSPRRRFQFRLRTLMIVVTLLAGVCACVGWQAKIVRERAAILGELRTNDWPHDPFGAFTMRDFYQLNVDPSATSQFISLKPELLVSGDRNQLPSFIRGVFGDDEVRTILLPNSVNDVKVARFAKLFPEADIWRCK